MPLACLSSLLQPPSSKTYVSLKLRSQQIPASAAAAANPSHPEGLLELVLLNLSWLLQGQG